MRHVLPSLLLACAPLAAQEGGGSAHAMKGYHVETREQCMDESSFNGFLALGVDSWGIDSGQSQRAVDLLGAAIQCRAFAASSPEECERLASVPRFAAGKLLAADCRSEHHILAFQAAMRGLDTKRAEAACVSWFKENMKHFDAQFDPSPDCGQIVKFLGDGRPSPCPRLAAALTAGERDEAAAAAAAGLCGAVFLADPKACSPKVPVSRSSCLGVAEIARALRTRREADCPKSARYGGLCRAMLAKDPAAACDKARKEWQGLLCAPRFEAQHGGGE